MTIPHFAEKIDRVKGYFSNKISRKIVPNIARYM